MIFTPGVKNNIFPARIQDNMKIAILSDSHDNIPNLRMAVELCNKRGTGMIIHCGDLISPFMLDELAEFTGAVHLIYGNNAGDQHLI